MNPTGGDQAGGGDGSGGGIGIGGDGSGGGGVAADQQARSRRLTWLRRGVVAVLLAGIGAFLVEGADQPADPFLVPAGEGGAETRSGEAAAPVAPAAPAPSDDGSSSSTTAAAPSSTDAPPRTTAVPAPADRSGAATAPSSTPAPSTAPPSPPASAAPAPPARRPLAGFGEVPFRISRADGAAFDGFALLADNNRTQGQGLMGQTDLRGYDAMVFRFGRPSEGSFYMLNTLIPLSIAFFDAEGRFVSATDMVPCGTTRPCPTYPPKGPYVHAIEVPVGGLPRLGIGPGAVLTFPRP